MHDGRSTPAVLRRLTAVLALRGLSVRVFAARLGVSDGHLRGVLLGERNASERLMAALIEALGQADWLFIRGQVNTLTMPGTKGAA